MHDVPEIVYDAYPFRCGEADNRHKRKCVHDKLYVVLDEIPL